MASQSGEASAMFDQLRSSLFPILLGLMGPTPDSDHPDRLVLVNPATRGMVILRGDSATIAEIVSAGGGEAIVTPPAAKSAIEALKEVEIDQDSEEEEEECTVCLDGLKERKEEVVKEMPCRHRFHGGCIEKWLKMHGSCPVCRFLIPVEETGAKKQQGGEEGEEQEARRSREVWVTIAVRRRSGDGDGDGDGVNHVEE